MMVDFTGRSNPHIHYVALSRVDTIDHLHIAAFDPKKIKVSKPVLEEMERLRMHSLKRDIPISDSKTLVAYINAQSLHRHLSDVECDYRLSRAQILICSETRLVSRDTDALSQFKSVFRNDEIISSSTNRPFHGMAVYCKEEFSATPAIANVGPVECIITPVQFAGRGYVKIASIYALPNASPHQLERSLVEIIDGHDLSSTSTIFIGDFNVDIYNKDESNYLLSFFARRGYRQLISAPTTDGRTCLDHIYTGLESKSHGTWETYYSYHKAIWIEV